MGWQDKIVTEQARNKESTAWTEIEAQETCRHDLNRPPLIHAYYTREADRDRKTSGGRSEKTQIECTGAMPRSDLEFGCLRHRRRSLQVALHGVIHGLRPLGVVLGAHVARHHGAVAVISEPHDVIVLVALPLQEHEVHRLDIEGRVVGLGDQSLHIGALETDHVFIVHCKREIIIGRKEEQELIHCVCCYCFIRTTSRL